MAQTVVHEPKFLNISQTSEFLGVGRITIYDICRLHEIKFKSVPGRYGHFLNSSDIDRIASALNLVVDWTTEKVLPIAH